MNARQSFTYPSLLGEVKSFGDGYTACHNSVPKRIMAA